MPNQTNKDSMADSILETQPALSACRANGKGDARSVAPYERGKTEEPPECRLAPERSQLDQILREQALSRTRLFDEQTASRLGRLVSARAVITGSIVNSQDRIFVTAQMIDVETSKIISTHEMGADLIDSFSAGNMAEGLALKLHQDFPLIDGHIIEMKGKNMVVDIGQNGTKPGRRLIIFRGEPVIHPVTGKTVGTDIRVVAHAVVTQVLPETSRAMVLDADEGGVNRLDRVITE